MKLRHLSTRFTNKGFTLQQVERTGDVAVFSKVWDDTGRQTFETVLVRRAKPHPNDTNGWDEVELYPSSEAWGTLGWTYTDLPSARQRAATLLAA